MANSTNNQNKLHQLFFFLRKLKIQVEFWCDFIKKLFWLKGWDAYEWQLFLFFFCLHREKKMASIHPLCVILIELLYFFEETMNFGMKIYIWFLTFLFFFSMHDSKCCWYRFCLSYMVNKSNQKMYIAYSSLRNIRKKWNWRCLTKRYNFFSR